MAMPEFNDAVLPAGADATSLPRVGEVIGALSDRFERYGSLGVLLLDAGVLGTIEARAGDRARCEAARAIGNLIGKIAYERLDIDDMAVAGEVGRHEILVLIFRKDAGGGLLRQDLPGFAQSLRRELAGPSQRILYPHWRRPVHIGAGMAVALRNPKWSADTQLRQVIEEARADSQLEAQIRRRERRRQMVETVLDRAIFSVYEPIVDVPSRTVYGYEALARGPERTELHSPAVLFQLAQEEDLVFELDCLCRASGLRGAVGLPEGTALFLNIRPTTIHDPSFRPDRLIETLAECRLSPKDVVFEVSEQESIASFQAFREVSDTYRELGFRFALDDTGAGYAGLEALLEISPDFVKVDRAFVSGIDQDPVRRAMLQGLTTVADKIGAKIIAEGLDTLEELETLAELGIPFGQGWLFGKPTPLLAQAEGEHSFPDE